MALKSFCPCCFFCWNLFIINQVEDKLAKDQEAAKSSHSGSISPAPSYNLTTSLALVLALISALVSILVLVLAPALVSSDKLFKQFIKTYLESNQRPSQLLAGRK